MTPDYKQDALGGSGSETFPQRLNRLLKNSWSGPQSPSAAKAVAENEPLIAAVNRCATQEQEQNRVFQHSVKPGLILLHLRRG